MKIQSTLISDIVLTLHLSRLEATILRAILRNVSGPSNGPRGMASDLADHLRDQGVPCLLLNPPAGGIALPDSWDDEALVASQEPD